MIIYKQLTKGERFWLMRRRTQMRTDKAARNYKCTEDRICGWEAGKDSAGCPDVVLAPKLTIGESLSIARRRKGWTLHATAAKMKTSHVTLIKWEGDRNSTQDRAVAFWDRKGWPGVRAA